jgi:hypothetical protein
VKVRYPLLDDYMGRYKVLVEDSKTFRPIADYIHLIEKDFAGRTGTTKKAN